MVRPLTASLPSSYQMRQLSTMVATDTIIAFLCEKITVAEFADTIDQEVTCYVAALAERGASVPIFVTEGRPYNVTSAQIGILDRAITTGGLSVDARSYVADAIIMADCLFVPEDDDALDCLHAIANP